VKPHQALLATGTLTEWETGQAAHSEASRAGVKVAARAKIRPAFAGSLGGPFSSSGDGMINFICLDFETLSALSRICTQRAVGVPSQLRIWRSNMKRLAVSVLALAAFTAPSWRPTAPRTTNPSGQQFASRQEPDPRAVCAAQPHCVCVVLTPARRRRSGSRTIFFNKLGSASCQAEDVFNQINSSPLAKKK